MLSPITICSSRFLVRTNMVGPFPFRGHMAAVTVPDGPSPFRLDECGRRSLDATNFRRKLQGKRPVRPENQPLLILLIKLKDLAPW
jgi:hypothetical protein